MREVILNQEFTRHVFHQTAGIEMKKHCIGILLHKI